MVVREDLTEKEEEAVNVTMLPNQTRAPRSMRSKANPLTLLGGEGKYSVYCRAKQGE